MESSRDVDARTDLWALGVSLFELIAGKTPFHAERIEELCTRVYMKPPTPLTTYRSDAPPGFEAVLAQCFEKERERRWPHVAALAAALAPFGPPSAVGSAARAAAVLGQHVEPLRLTGRLSPEPSARAGMAGTGSAVVKVATVAAPRSRRVVLAGVALAGIVLMVGVMVRRQGMPEPPHTVGTAPAVPAAEVSSVPERDGAAPVAPVSASAVAVVLSATVAPATRSPRPRSKALQPSPPTAPPAPVTTPPAKPAKGLYDGQ
jgi:serine/threonine-protein kinase